MGILDRIREIKEEIKRTQYNKATEHHIGTLKAKLAKLKAQLERHARKEGGKGFAVKKEGDATVLFVGLPSVGKSSLLTALTGRESKAASYAFTTLDLIPAMLKTSSLNIQLIDAPGVIKGASSGKGRGREVLTIVRSADLVLLVLDASRAEEELSIIKDELYNAAIRINEEPPNVYIEKKHQGGIEIMGRAKCFGVNRKTVVSVLNEFGIHNANVIINEPIDVNRLVDVLAGNRYYTSALVIINKVDIVSRERLKELKKAFLSAIFVSAQTGEGIEELKTAIVKHLRLMRIYTRDEYGNIDKEEPLILKESSTVRDFCRAIHKDLLKNFRWAQVWGPSAKFAGQRVGLNHKLKDGDVVFIKAYK